MGWRDAVLVFQDVETTGLDVFKDRVVEVAAYACRLDGECLGSFQRLCDPGVPLPAIITEITGITREDLITAAPFPAAEYRDFLAQWPDAIHVAYNAPFDFPFLSTEFARARVESPPQYASRNAQADWIDPLVWVRMREPYPKGKGYHKQPNVAARWGCLQGAAHRALGDCQTTAAILKVLAEYRTKDTQELMMPEELPAVIAKQSFARARSDAERLGRTKGW